MPTAMVIEDDPQVRELFDEVLRQSGFTMLLAGSAPEAIRMLNKNTPDIVFVDLNMPEHPGTEVLAHIRQSPQLSACKVVVVTANDRADSRAQEYNVDLFLVKPVNVIEMTRLARRLTGLG